ncbi:MAG: alkaline phosphatase [Saprospiraceae bacterium]|nr:alkaline phosphatase [Saprospiraceae bacterium]
MKRRDFFKYGSLLSLFGLGSSSSAWALDLAEPLASKKKRAKNIIFMVSDGMSTGTLNMADLYLQRQFGQGSNWLNLYRNNLVTRGLMDMASASSIVTDSSAASSSWGCGQRVKNGVLNVDANGNELTTIWQKFKNGGKKAGCVTSVPVTHATPAGFCISATSRNTQEEIAQKYLVMGMDLLLGGGDKFFNPEKRSDKQDMYKKYHNAGYQIVKNRTELSGSVSGKPLLGTFGDDALPYWLDHKTDTELENSVPTLAAMTAVAIDHLKGSKEGFVLQIEGGKVDWAAHANDIGGLLFDQLAFDEAIKVAIDFAAKDKETLVIICTDHGNANPGLIYGSQVNENFDNLHKFQKTNDWILQSILPTHTTADIQQRIFNANGFEISTEEAQKLLGFYTGLQAEEAGLYNYKNLPFSALADIQKKRTSVGWISMNHSGDFVEIAMYGPGSHLHKPFIKNTELHTLMLKACGVG